jgi:hypothetical protein
MGRFAHGVLGLSLSKPSSAATSVRRNPATVRRTKATVPLRRQILTSSDRKKGAQSVDRARSAGPQVDDVVSEVLCRGGACAHGSHDEQSRHGVTNAAPRLTARGTARTHAFAATPLLDHPWKLSRSTSLALVAGPPPTPVPGQRQQRTVGAASGPPRRRTSLADCAGRREPARLKVFPPSGQVILAGILAEGETNAISRSCNHCDVGVPGRRV